MIDHIIFLLNCRYPIVMLFILAFYKAICDTSLFRIYIHKILFRFFYLGKKKKSFVKYVGILNTAPFSVEEKKTFCDCFFSASA